MARVTGRPDRLKIVGELRGIVDAIATGGIIPSGGYETLRRQLPSDLELRPFLPNWRSPTRTSDEARTLLGRQRNSVEFVKSSFEPALSHLEDQAFNPRREEGPPPVNCPYCSIKMSPVRDRMAYGGSMFWQDQGVQARVEAVACPECRGVFLLHSHFETQDGGEPGTATWRDLDSAVLWPRVSSRQPVPPEVPEQYASLAREAGLILPDSPRASAALSRRCLQQLLRNEAEAPPGKLYFEIEWALANAGLPSRATRSLHSLREIGNMAAHPNMGPESDDYLEVEPGEADWTLDVLDDLFDHFFVGPALEAARRAALDAKLGKTPD